MLLIKSGKAQLGQIVRRQVPTLCSSEVPFAHMVFSIFIKSV